MGNKMITFRFTDEFYLHLVRESHRLSLERNANLSISDLIREALEAEYPINTSDKKKRGKKNGKKG